MKVTETALPGVLIIEPTVFGDDRGFFVEHYQAARYQEHLGNDVTFIQDNMSRSGAHILRGLHYQLRHTQGKLVWVTQGRAFDVIVDVRYGSPTFAHVVTVELDAKTQNQVYIPPGFAHGFCTLASVVDFQYKCTDIYDPDSEMTVLWNDPDLEIAWPVTHPIISPKDQNGLRLQDIPSEKLPVYSEHQ